MSSAAIDTPFNFTEGDTPLLVSMPHCGTQLTNAVKTGLTSRASDLPDTDWHIPQLYDFLEPLGVSSIAANYSRYVIDLNRPADDTPLYSSPTTSLFPEILFDSSAVFTDGGIPSDEERNRYKAQIWQPYHDKIHQELLRLKQQFGYAILFDAHSIHSHVPMLFEGKLADFNWGTNQGESCDNSIEQAMKATCEKNENYTHVVNGRFKGGYITRFHGQPANNIHAIQLELSQATYMEEQAPFPYREELAAPTKKLLQQLISTLSTWTPFH